VFREKTEYLVVLTVNTKHKIPENSHHWLETHSSGQPNDSNHDRDIKCGRTPPSPPLSSDSYLMVHRLDPLILRLSDWCTQFSSHTTRLVPSLCFSHWTVRGESDTPYLYKSLCFSLLATWTVHLTNKVYYLLNYLGVRVLRTTSPNDYPCLEFVSLNIGFRGNVLSNKRDKAFYELWTYLSRSPFPAGNT
jgi:hypothetical protein